MADTCLLNIALENYKEEKLFADVQSVNSNVSTENKINLDDTNEVWKTSESNHLQLSLKDVYPYKFEDNLPVRMNPLFDNEAAFGSEDV
ncbi:unnamed protein product [Dimorphilus gyrociliatus]|uniref:Uncharacterized protein n=1 Tax=Dimorphilus gyrociliatus TaxID=2664684 RepID=A0A7I8VIE8_9ANNE|nr:unnamed protein product [Dimorphilus gyrociliatus]